MKRRIELYINNQVADLDEESLVLFNYTKENIDNPSVVRNSYSKQITLKGTARNNRIFDGMYRSDRLSPSGRISVMDQIPFKIIADKGIAVESGYCKIDSVQRDGAKITYTITLYGGLGSFFYKLATNEDGDSLSLADLEYAEGEYDADTSVGLGASALDTLWDELQDYLESGTIEDLGSVINFNPCYNGVMDNFDNTKVMVKAGDYSNTPSSISGYAPKTGAGGKYILQMDRAYDVQDTNDCRAYLMRPMVNVLAVLAAIKDYATSEIGFTLDYDDIKNLPYIKNAWMALANVPSDKRTTITLGELLDGTPSPASFLISIARLFGFSFIADTEGNVSIKTRNTFFNTGLPTIDLTHRVDVSKQRTLSPVYADNRWFDFALEGVGETAKVHKEEYGREYGSQRVDTSYPFGEGVQSVWDGSAFKISAEVEESGIDRTRAVVLGAGSGADFRSFFFLPVVSSSGNGMGTPIASLYDGDGNVQEVELPLSVKVGSTTYVGTRKVADETENDFFLRNQLCEDDRKAVEDAGTIMLLRPSFLTTQETSISFGSEDVTIDRRIFYLHSYDSKMVELTGGEECWDMTKSAVSRADIPLWSNTGYVLSEGDFNEDYNDDYDIEGSDIPIAILPTNIYTAMWQNYIQDRYDKDARILKCYVDFSGMQVGDALLRRFYFYDNALWVLNKITNYSLTTYDAVECEFVRVMDKENYTNGQI